MAQIAEQRAPPRVLDPRGGASTTPLGALPWAAALFGADYKLFRSLHYRVGVKLGDAKT
jgi:hypothetical protein